MLREKAEPVKPDTIVYITIGEEIAINWDNQSSSIVEDSLYDSIMERIDSLRTSLVHKISDKETTTAVSCNKATPLAKGDIAFILINKIENIPYFEAYGVQWDSYSLDCKYHHGMLDYVELNRDVIQEKTISCFEE